MVRDGDSWPACDGADDLADRWGEDLAAVVAHARGLVGPDAPVHLVGLRLGAAVLARLPHETCGPGRRIYWEPVSGAAFLRNHALIRKSSVPVPVADSGTELDGVWLSPPQTASVRGLAAPKAAALTDGDLIRSEADRRTAMRLALGAPYFAHVPLAALREIVETLPPGRERRLEEWEPVTTVTGTTAGPQGRGEVTETMLEIGPHRLPAIRTQSCDVNPSVAVLFTAMGAEIKAGPGGLWSRTARELAAAGAVCLRADRSGLGDDADPQLAAEPRPYTQEAIDDVALAITDLAGTGLPVLGVGVCAGAWAMLRAAGPGYDAPLTEMVGINVVHWHPDPLVYTEAFYEHYHGQEATDRSAPAPSPGAAVEEDDAPPPEAAAPATPRDRIARAKDWAFTELAIRYPRLRSALRHDVPLDLAEPMLRQVPADLALTLLYGAHDHRIWVGKGGRRSLRRARRRGLPLTVTRDPGVDHSLFAQRAQGATIELLCERTAALAAHARATPAPRAGSARPARFDQADQTDRPDASAGEARA